MPAVAHLLTQTAIVKRKALDGTVVNGQPGHTIATISSTAPCRLTRPKDPVQIVDEERAIIARRIIMFDAGEDVEHGDAITISGLTYNLLNPTAIPDGAGADHHIEGFAEEVT